MLPDQEQEVPAVFSDWYDNTEIEELLCMPLYRNLLNTNLTLNLHSYVSNRFYIQERRLQKLVIPQIESFLIELTALEEDTVTHRKYAYLKLCVRTLNTKDSNSDIRIAEIRISEGSAYSLEELVEGSMLSLYDLPPLLLFQVKEINTLTCKVRIGPIESIEI
ncbi:MAG: hypothetical protein ACMG57_03110 [Candidatus Dojkabacteria bacterium]